MARSGCFNDLSAAFNFHPSSFNMASKGTCVGVYDAVFAFHGVAAHAGGSPEKGRSALDAVELMNVGVNYLREHVPEKVRIHYAIRHGGDVPNIVPAEASVWYFVRAKNRRLLDEVYGRVCRVAEGAALMTGTELEIEFGGACSSVLNNRRLADLQFAAMKRIGPIEFSEEELAAAREINGHYPEENATSLFDEFSVPESERARVEQAKGRPLIGANFPSMDESFIGTGSTDVGDVSWITPLSMLSTACFATGASGHSWGIVASSGSSFGKKGMMHAAKIMAVASAEVVLHPEILAEARSEFEAAIKKAPYTNPIPDEIEPPPSGVAGPTESHA
jgi:aminobenzoyl-glutamate utilization protein B